MNPMLATAAHPATDGPIDLQIRETEMRAGRRKP